MIGSGHGRESTSFSGSNLVSEIGIQLEASSVFTISDVVTLISIFLESGKIDFLTSLIRCGLWELHHHIFPDGLS